MIEVKRIQSYQGELLKELRLRALKDSPNAFLGNYDTASNQPIEHWQECAKKHATSPLAVNFFGFLDSEPAGMVGAYVANDEPNVVNLCALWVAPEARQQGVGKALVDQAIHWARQVDARKIRLWVNRENVGATQFYHRCGFQETGITAVFPAKPDAVEKEMVYSFSDSAEPMD